MFVAADSALNSFRNSLNFLMYFLKRDCYKVSFPLNLKIFIIGILLKKCKKRPAFSKCVPSSFSVDGKHFISSIFSASSFLIAR